MAEPRIFIECMDYSVMSGPFEELSKEQMIRVDENRTELNYRKGEILCKQGAFISNMIFIKSGLVKIFLEDEIHPPIISLEGPGYFLGLPSLYVGGVYHYTVEALEDTEVCLVDINTFKDLIDENPGFATGIMKYFNIDLVKSYSRLYSETRKQIRGRFAELLLYLKDHIYKENPYTLSISRKEMADMISTSHESISRMMKEFKTDKIIKFKHHELNILNEEKLKKISLLG